MAKTGELDRATIWTEFAEAVNMTPAALDKWLGTEESRAVGWTHEGEGEAVGHQEGRRIVEMKHKTKGTSPTRITPICARWWATSAATWRRAARRRTRSIPAGAPR
jgi:hypothetical protein